MDRLIWEKNRLFFLLLILFGFSSAAEAENHFDPLWNSLRHYDNVLVSKVIRADTFILESGERIKLIGLASPPPPKKKYSPPIGTPQETTQTPKVEDPTTPIEEQALEFSRDLLEGKYVRLEFDVQKQDENFYTLAYAFLKDNTFVNAEILRQGFANLKIVPPNIQYVDLLREAYQEARREKRGLQSE